MSACIPVIVDESQHALEFCGFGFETDTEMPQVCACACVLVLSVPWSMAKRLALTWISEVLKDPNLVARSVRGGGVRF